MSTDGDWVPNSLEGVTRLMEGLSFEFDAEVSESEVPPVLSEGQDALIPRSFKLPMGLDAELAELAARDRAEVRIEP